jgi:golgin subfamily B member 1
MPTLREYESAFESNPDDTQAFLALRKVYRERRKFDNLVTLYETRAQSLTEDAKSADLFYLAAEVRIDHLADSAGAEIDLRHALDRYPAHVKAAERLKLMFRDQGRARDYMTMMEIEAGAVVQSQDNQRRALLQQELAQLFSTTIAPMERAVAGPQRGRALSDDDLATIESARKIYRALADWPNVVRLYELELAAVTEGKKRIDLMLAYGKVLADRMGRLEEAVEKWSEVARLAPREEKPLELLAGVYAHPEWPSADGKERSAAMYYQIARRRQESGDLDGAIALLRKGITALPTHEESGKLIERILYEGRRLKELDRYYRERVTVAISPEEKMDFLFKRAQLAERDLKDPGEALSVYEEIVGIEPPGGPASQHLAELYLGRKNYAKLADLRERQLESISDPVVRLPILGELAVLYRDRLGDAEQSAVYVHAMLQIDPGNEEAQTAYADHFRRKSDWASLLDLLEFSADHARKSGESVEKLAARLEEVAVLAERHLGDVDRALKAWRRTEEIAPESDRAREAQKRILLKEKNWEGLAGVLEREASRTTDPGKRQDLQRRLAKIYVEKIGDGGRGVQWFRKALAEDPADAASFRALTDLYEAQENWVELAACVRGHVATVPLAEKITLLRRLAFLYEEKLGAVAESIWATREILTLSPDDRESFVRLQTILARIGDVAGLVAVLEQHAERSEGSEQNELLRRAARSRQDELQDLAGAALQWERLLERLPQDEQAISALVDLYAKLNQPTDEARVLDQQIESHRDNPSALAEALLRLGRLSTDLLKDAERASAAWESRLQLLPGDTESLAALAAIYRDSQRWRDLDRVLAECVALARDPASAVPLALERAAVIEEHLRSPGRAVEVLEQIVGELDPRNAEAFARLRRVSESQGDWQRVVIVCERQLFLRDQLQDRLQIALEIGEIQRDRLGDPDQAIAAFERVLGMTPDHPGALAALALLYASTGQPEKLIATDQNLLAQTEDPVERRRLMNEIADTSEADLGDPRSAFEWARRLHQEQPDDATIHRLETLSAHHKLWEDLVRVYEGERARIGEASRQIEVSRRMAAVCEQRLMDPARAFNVLRDTLNSDPSGELLLPELERLGDVAQVWSALLDVYARVSRVRDTVDERVALLERRAQIRETHLADASGALDEWLKSFALNPAGERTHFEILRLARNTGRWEDALKVEGQRFGLAAEIDEKVEIAKRAAAIVEEEVKDNVRAFRAYLNAFRLAPEDADIVRHLWRLAEKIGSFVAQPPAVAAPIEMLITKEVGRSSALADSTIYLDVTQPSNESTVALDLDEIEELSDISDLEDLEETPAPVSVRPPPPPPKVAVRVSTPWEEFAQAYAQLPVNDNASHRRNLLHQAAIWEKGAGDNDKALSLVERAFALDPFEEETTAELKRLGETYGTWDRVCRIYLSAITSSMQSDDAIKLHQEVATIRERIGDRAEAEMRYRAILDLDSAHIASLDRLESFYRSDERWRDLASLLERRVSFAEDVVSDSSARARSRELAALYENQLDRPYEAIDTLERSLRTIEDEARATEDPELLEELASLLDGLARLYGRVDLISKAIDTLGRLRDLATDAGQRRLIGLRIAELQGGHAGGTNRALEAYESVLADAPDDVDALNALDKAYEALGRYEDLVAVLQRRIALASAGDKIELVIRLAGIYEERMGNPDAAATALRGLGALVIENNDVAIALLRNLRRAGLAHEAATLLSQRIDRFDAINASSGEIGALYVELGRLRLEDMDDTAGATQALQRALDVDTDRSDALSLLGKIYLERNDFATYAELRVREARGQSNNPDAVAAWLDAGDVFRGQLRDARRAENCFEEALRLDPDNTRALRALVSVLSSEGQEARAQALLQKQLEIVSRPEARAVVLTDLARLCWEQPGDLARVMPWLDEALELDPDYLPALVTLADVYYREGEWDQAERRLTQALRRMRGKGAETASLVFRLGEVYEKLGRLEDGYRNLQEFDRKNPDQLLIRIAVGVNRAKARKWREAAVQLEKIVEHPDASQYPEEVARGLAFGGEALVKLKNPDRARTLFELALSYVADLKMAHIALADLCVESGDWTAAVDHLQKVVETSHDRVEKTTLLERIGDLHCEHGRAEDGRAYYENAVSLIDVSSESTVGLLEKTLTLQKQAGAVAEATETSTKLIGLVADPRERALKRRDAASTLLEHGQVARAAELLAQTLEDTPDDERALTMLVAAHARLQKPEASVFMLERILPGLPAVGSKAETRAQRAALWETLGKLRRPTDIQSAIRALEHSVSVNPASIEARVALADLYDEAKDSGEASLQNHREMAMLDVTRKESLRALAKAHDASGSIDAARCCYQVLSVLGLAKKNDKAFLKKYAVNEQRPDEPYPGVLNDELRKHHLSHPEARDLAEVFSTIWEGGFDLDGPTLEKLNVKMEDRISPMSEQDFAKILAEVSKALDNKHVGVFTGWDPSTKNIQIALARPPALVVASSLFDRASAAELRFRLARALELSRPEYILAATVPPRAFAKLFGNVLKAFHPKHARRRGGTDVAGTDAAQLKKALPYKVSKRLAELFASVGNTPFSSARWRDVVEESGNRAGLLMCGDLDVAARIVLADKLQMPVAEVDVAMLLDHATQPGPLRELLRFAISDEYIAVRDALGISVRDVAA